MSPTLAALPSEFSWLHPACRPSPKEVDAYTHFIANHESAAISALTDVSRRRDEAELQLWLWRSEARQRKRRSRVAAASSV